MHTQKTLTPSENVAIDEFKSVDSIVSDLKPVNKFKLNVSNVLGVNEKILVFKNKNREINLSKYVNLYLLPPNNEEFDILKQEINTEVLFFNSQNVITRTSVNNGK